MKFIIFRTNPDFICNKGNLPYSTQFRVPTVIQKRKIGARWCMFNIICRNPALKETSSCRYAKTKMPLATSFNVHLHRKTPRHVGIDITINIYIYILHLHFLGTIMPYEYLYIYNMLKLQYIYTLQGFRKKNAKKQRSGLLVGAQPSPCCSFAPHLVGTMIIHCSFAHH